MTEKEIKDILQIEGVGAKGGGILPKYAMLDTDLTLEAKTLYAYFCSMAGSGKTAFPGRDTILNQLGIGKKAYYHHMNLLKDQNYISITQQKTVNNPKFSHNIYNIVSNPKKFAEMQETVIGDSISRIKQSGLKAGGYGYIPYLVMIDPRLDIKAKGIYSYLCTYTGAGNSAYPRKDYLLYHLGISHATYLKYMQQLTEINYITVIRRRNADGTMSCNDYYINDIPYIGPEYKKGDTVSEPEYKKEDTVSEPEYKKEDTVSEPEYKKEDTVSEPKYKKGDTVSEPEYKKGDTVFEPEYKKGGTVFGPEYKKADTEKEDNKITSTNITKYNSSSYSSIFTPAICIQQFGKDTLYVDIYGLLMMGFRNIGPEGEKKINNLIKDNKFIDFCVSVMKSYAGACITKHILNPPKYMHRYILNALMTYDWCQKKEATHHSGNKFHNFEQRDIDYNAVMLERVNQWLNSSNETI